jgi:hypothetical protein
MSDFESGAFNRALPTLRSLHFTLNLALGIALGMEGFGGQGMDSGA